jgi:microcystin-dependent protein
MAVYPQSVLSPDPLWLQSKSYDARSLRKPFSDILSPGVEDAASFAVTINSGLQLSIAAGTAYVLGQNVTDQGLYRQYTTAAVLVTANAFNEARIEIVPGTATAGATLDNRNGAANLTTLGEASKSVLLLADVLVPATSGAVTVRDRRAQARLLVQGALPAGTSIEYNGAGTPAGGFFPEDGSAISRFTYSELFAAIGTLWGAGDGSTTFAVPDKRGRTSVGKGTHTDVDTVGKTDGVAVGTRRMAHGHTNDLSLGVSNTVGGNQVYNGTTGNVQYNVNFSGGVGVTGMVNTPAFAVCAKWIKY